MASPVERYAQSWESGFKRLDALLGDQVTDHLHREPVRQLEVVGLVSAAAQLGLWLMVNLSQGSLALEFATPLEWGFPAGARRTLRGCDWLPAEHRH